MTMPAHWTDRLSEYLDRELSAAEEAAADEHLGRCAACRHTLAELREVRALARQLAPTPPDTDLWPAIAAAIGSAAAVRRTEVTPLRAPRRYTFSLPQLAAAGIALAALTGSGVWLARGGDGNMPPSVQPTRMMRRLVTSNRSSKAGGSISIRRRFACSSPTSHSSIPRSPKRSAPSPPIRRTHT